LGSTYDLFPSTTLETRSENKPADSTRADGRCCVPCTLAQSGDCWLISAFTTRHAAGAGAGLLTCTVGRGQHDGGDPRDLAIGRAKEILDFFEEDGYAFGEGVREADRHESAEDHHPAPTAVRQAGGSPRVMGGRHGRAARAASGTPETQKGEGAE